jgi:N-acetylglucosaminyl-diphospho-decaprenol L-rhamnosyltransferase
MNTASGEIRETDPVDVAFITINYNTKALVEDLINFLMGANLPFSYSLTVVDNNSSDGSMDAISRNPLVRIIHNDRNLGYGVAANRGVAATKSRYVCVLNTDLILNNGALAAIWRFMEENETVGVCTPVVRYNDGRMQGFFFKFSLLLYYCELPAKLYTKLKKLLILRARQPVKLDGIFGALLFLRRSFIGEDTLFDEDYFFYFEDADLAYRWKKRGIESFVLPDHSIIHLGGQSGQGRNKALYYAGKYIFLQKHYSERHARIIKRIDFYKIARKVVTYRLISFIFPTKRIKQKLSSYRDYLRQLIA